MEHDGTPYRLRRESPRVAVLTDGRVASWNEGADAWREGRRGG